MPSVDKPSKSKEKDTGDEKKNEGSFFQNLKNSLFEGSVGKQEDKKPSKSSEGVDGKIKDKTSIKDKASTSPSKKEKTEKEESVFQTKKEVRIPQTKKEGIVPQTKSISQTKKKDSPPTEKKDTIPQDQEEDPALHLIEDIKANEIVQSLRERKDQIIKGVAITVSAILIIIAIIYSLTPTEQVASNVIFGEGAMFSVFLVLVAFLILAAVFASRLLGGKYLKDIHQNLEIVEGKRQRDDQKQEDDQKKSKHDPNIEGMNKKDK